MNKVNLIGRIVEDLELKTSVSGTSFINFNLAVRRKIKDKQSDKDTDFIRIIAFGKLAEAIVNYVNKGCKIGIIGRLQK